MHTQEKRKENKEREGRKVHLTSKERLAAQEFSFIGGKKRRQIRRDIPCIRL